LYIVIYRLSVILHNSISKHFANPPGQAVRLPVLVPARMTLSGWQAGTGFIHYLRDKY
jgi:hypothetical protein